MTLIITFLSTSFAQEIKQFKTQIQNHPELKHRKELLERIPETGKATINVILSEFGNITQFRNAKALAVFIGVGCTKVQPLIIELKKRLPTAAMRILVHIIYGVLKNGIPFDENLA